MSDQNPYTDKPYGGGSGYGEQSGYGAPAGGGSGSGSGSGSGGPVGGGSGYGAPSGPGDQAAYAYPHYQPTMAAGVGWQHQSPAAYGGASAATLLTIGDIAVMSDGIMTPAGALPLHGAVWTVSDMSRTEESTPAYAIVLAVIFFFACLLGLLFLLVKEHRTTGFIQVTVNSGGRYHATMIPARTPNDVYAVNQQVNHARSLCA